MPGPLATAVFATILIVNAADVVQQFDVEPTCRGAATAGFTFGRTAEICKTDEQNARAELEKKWTQFAQDDREKCVALSKTGGAPSYVEVLTCLEMSRDAKALRSSNSLGGL